MIWRDWASAIGMAALLYAVALGGVWAHGIGEPELEKTAVFKQCCNERDCAHRPMLLRERGEGKALVWIEGLGEVQVPAIVVRDEPATFPVLCTVGGGAANGILEGKRNFRGQHFMSFLSQKGAVVLKP